MKAHSESSGTLRLLSITIIRPLVQQIKPKKPEKLFRDETIKQQKNQDKINWGQVTNNQTKKQTSTIQPFIDPSLPLNCLSQPLIKNTQVLISSSQSSIDPNEPIIKQEEPQDNPPQAQFKLVQSLANLSEGQSMKRARIRRPLSKKIGFTWSVAQHTRYLLFMLKNKELFQSSREQRKEKCINKQMSKAVRTRNATQCHTHHQKLMATYGSIERILEKEHHYIPNERLPHRYQPSQP